MIDYKSILKVLNVIYEGSVGLNDIILIIPNAACPGCISSSEEFMITNCGLYNNRIKFILTNFKSPKQLKIKIGEDILKSENVYLDKYNIVWKQGINSIYPIVIYLKDGVVFLVELVSPENGGVYDRILGSVINQ
jgi:hypothetical protein